MKALLLLAEKYPETHGTCTFTIFQGEMTPGTLRMLELTENVQREDMHWTEKMTNLAEAHELLSREKHKKSETWSQEETGRFFGLSKTPVWYATKLAEVIKSGDKEIIACDGPGHALRLLLTRQEDAARAELVKRQALRAGSLLPRIETAALSSPLEPLPPAQMGEDKGQESPPQNARNEGEREASPPSSNLIDVSNFYRLGNCIELMKEVEGKVNAIITDPPYGIEMSNLTNTSRVELTHEVKSNLLLLRDFIAQAFKTLTENGVLVMWYDVVHHQFLVDQAEKAGFKPVRWPLVWCKTTPCFNQAPQYNPTKATEFALVFKKGNYTMPKPMGSNFLVEPNERNATHPFFKPIKVWEFLLLNFTKEGDVVLDPFAGEGSCPLSCLLNQRAPIAFEVDEKHYNNALTNLPLLYEKESKLKDVFSSFFSV